MDRTATIGRIESVINELPDDKLIHLWELMIEVFFKEDVKLEYKKPDDNIPLF